MALTVAARSPARVAARATICSPHATRGARKPSAINRRSVVVCAKKKKKTTKKVSGGNLVEWDALSR